MIKSDDLLARIKRQGKSKKSKVSSSGNKAVYATVESHPHPSKSDSLHYQVNGQVYARVNKHRHISNEDHTYMTMDGLPHNSIKEFEYLSINGSLYGSIYEVVRRSSITSTRGPIYATLEWPLCNSIKGSQHSSIKEPVYASIKESIYATIQCSIYSKDNEREVRIPRHPYDVITHKVGGKATYECNDCIFTSLRCAGSYSKNLKRYKIKNPLEIPKGCLYRKKSIYNIVAIMINGEQIFECGDYCFRSYKDAIKYKENIYRNIDKKSFKIPGGILSKNEYLHKIIWYTVRDTKIYEFGNYAFATFQDVQQYSRLLLSNPNQKYYYPKNCLGESRHRINEFDITVFLGTNMFSYQIWSSIWSNCNFLCFSNKHFQVLKTKLLVEINTYRRKHGSPKLKYVLNLQKAAQKHANEILIKGKIAPSSDHSYLGTTIGVSYYLAASTIGKRWYDEIDNFGFILRKAKPGTQMFTQLIWRSSTRVGFGVAMQEDTIVVVGKFFPKGNQNRKYMFNVLPRG